ncbi:rhodanese domain protein [Anaplasma phagocytophilum str. ApNYW]|nr:rhodanese domain protein [Anaplasma phagocytophilum str. ApNYW]
MGGDCFVFDERVAVDNNIAPSEDIKCVKCFGKVDEADLRSVSKGHIVCGACNLQTYRKRRYRF